MFHAHICGWGQHSTQIVNKNNRAKNWQRDESPKQAILEWRRASTTLDDVVPWKIDWKMKKSRETENKWSAAIRSRWSRGKFLLRARILADSASLTYRKTREVQIFSHQLTPFSISALEIAAANVPMWENFPSKSDLWACLAESNRILPALDLFEGEREFPRREQREAINFN